MKLRVLTLAATSLLVASACSDSKDTPTALPAMDAGTDAGTDAGARADVPEPTYAEVVQPGCTTNGCILELTIGSALSQSLLSSAADPSFTVDNGVQLYSIRYYSDGDEITGTVFVPDSAPPAGGFPVVVMNQFTSGLGAPCAPSVGLLGIGVAATTALHGILTIVPDAPSYGPPPVGVYLVAKQAGRAAIDAARAAFHIAGVINQPVARNAVIAGLSQGGHSTMAAASELPTYAPNLEVRGFAAVAPPSHFRNDDTAVANADAKFPAFLAMRLFSWQRYFGFGTDPIFKEPYASSIEAWLTQDCIYDGSNGHTGNLEAHFVDKPSDTLTDKYLQYAKSDVWPPEWEIELQASTPLPSSQLAPIVIFQGTLDDTVPQAATDGYVKELRDGGLTIEYRVIDGGTHGTTALSSFTVPQAANDQALAWIQAHLAAP